MPSIATPVDYAIWDARQQKVYLQRQFENADQLKLALEAEWNILSQTFIHKSIDEWRQHLEAVVKNNTHVRTDRWDGRQDKRSARYSDRERRANNA